MKNFYKLLNGKKVTSGDSVINIASAPLNSSGTIVFIDGTKLDFLGGLSIESSRFENIGRYNKNEDGVFSVKEPKNINAKYFPIIGFGSGDNKNIGNTIFKFETSGNINLDDINPDADNYNKEKKIFSHTTKFKNLELGMDLNVTGSSVFDTDVIINSNTNVKTLEILKDPNSEIIKTVKLNDNANFDANNTDNTNTTLTIEGNLEAANITFGDNGSAVINEDTTIDNLMTVNKLIVKNKRCRYNW